MNPSQSHESKNRLGHEAEFKQRAILPTSEHHSSASASDEHQSAAKRQRTMSEIEKELEYVNQQTEGIYRTICKKDTLKRGKKMRILKPRIRILKRRILELEHEQLVLESKNIALEGANLETDSLARARHEVNVAQNERQIAWNEKETAWNDKDEALHTIGVSAELRKEKEAIVEAKFVIFQKKAIILRAKSAIVRERYKMQSTLQTTQLLTAEQQPAQHTERLGRVAEQQSQNISSSSQSRPSHQGGPGQSKYSGQGCSWYSA